jgi:GNAT superfamily N-acetyltransferase
VRTRSSSHVTIDVREASLADCQAVSGLVASLAQERGQDPPTESRCEAAAKACVDSPGHLLLIAQEAGEVVGFLVAHWIPFPMLAGREAYVSDLVVRRDRRGAGVGAQLVERAEERAKAEGCVRLMLNNMKAGEAYKRGFFKKLGYRERTDFANLVKMVAR